MLLKKSFKIVIFLFVSATVFTTVFAVGTFAVFPCAYKSEVISVCNGLQLEPELVFAIIKVESSFKKDKISNKGAVGLMQILPSTASYVSELYFQDVNFDLSNPKDNILIGATYLIYLYEKFDDKKTALSAYNAGEGNVKNWLLNNQYSSDGISLNYIPFKETANYVNKVYKYAKIYKLLYRF